LTDRRNATLKEKSKARKERNQARSKAGLKKGDPRQVDHIKAKLGKKSYDNSSGNLKVVTKSAHKKKMKNSASESGGRPVGSKDQSKRKQRKK
jgi:hypothetical protein